MSLPSLKGRERMTLLSLLTGIKMKENNIPTIHTLPRLDGRYVIYPRHSAGRYEYTFPHSKLLTLSC